MKFEARILNPDRVKSSSKKALTFAIEVAIQKALDEGLNPRTFNIGVAEVTVRGHKRPIARLFNRAIQLVNRESGTDCGGQSGNGRNQTKQGSSVHDLEHWTVAHSPTVCIGVTSRTKKWPRNKALLLIATDQSSIQDPEELIRKTTRTANRGLKTIEAGIKRNKR